MILVYKASFVKCYEIKISLIKFIVTILVTIVILYVCINKILFATIFAPTNWIYAMPFLNNFWNELRFFWIKKPSI
jgi:hypothetical protein